MLNAKYIFQVHKLIINYNKLQKESSNSGGHQFHQYQQNEQAPLVLTEFTHHDKRPRNMTLEI